MTSIYDDFMRQMAEYPLYDATDLKMIQNRYIKFKRDGHWHRLKISNIDQYRKATYTSLHTVLTALFSRVQRKPQIVPCVVTITNGRRRELRYIQPFTLTDQHVLEASGLKSPFHTLYPESAQFHLRAFYLGHREMWYQYFDIEGDPPSSKQLFMDIRCLHDAIIRRQLSPRQIPAFISTFYTQRRPSTRSPRHQSHAAFPMVPVSPTHALMTINTDPTPRQIPCTPPPIPEGAPQHGNHQVPQQEASLKERVPSIEDIKLHINDVIGSGKFQHNFLWQAAEWRFQQTLQRITDDTHANRLWRTFYRFLQGDVDSRAFYTFLDAESP